MRKYLVFNMPDDNNDFILANHGPDFYFILLDINNKLRSFLKHGHKFDTADDALLYMQDFIHQEMIDRDVNLDMVN